MTLISRNNFFFFSLQHGIRASLPSTILEPPFPPTFNENKKGGRTPPPISSLLTVADRSHVHSLVFIWHNAFKANKKVSLPSIHLEKTANLFNLAAIYSQIALSAYRSSPGRLKQAYNSFQAAAGSFAFLPDQAAAKALAAGAMLDLSPKCTSMLEHLMLAQAQECFFEKVIANAKPPGLCSKVVRQVGLYYEEAYAAITSHLL